ncbi:DNA-cytosine methyltransferase [Geminocystis sp. NIES-3708]|uniref:DNA cytosine methyltransferase n=1 Tax=Geminocystis sp. NIES-3708 TaxID=1615909 RepID=UPI0005FC8894|nr:DNA cytosine methyltransferase [Geminocystis sp. NIES-3708]BAQ62937.1 DNA-cytosine methyltransferase [Geminocystis sp. NIES-3708]
MQINIQKQIKHKKYTVVDLFSGCGGLSYGFELTNKFEIKLAIDHDKKALETLKFNKPSISIFHEDIRNINPESIIEKYGSIDLVIGGPPCQGFSIAGKREFKDDRNNLFLEFIRFVKYLRPKMFVLENVTGFTNLYKGKAKELFKEKMNILGYHVQDKILLASDYGVPQIRKRVFFIGNIYGKNFIYPEVKLKEKDYITCEMAISDLPSLINEVGYEGMNYPTNPESEYQKLMRHNSELIYNHIATKHSPKIIETIKLVPEGGNYKNLPLELQKTRNFNIAWTRYHSKKPSNTIDTGHRHYFHYKYNRVPTVREHARLQSFPDSFRFMGNKTNQNRQVGNAVPPLLAKALAESIYNFL